MEIAIVGLGSLGAHLAVRLSQLNLNLRQVITRDVAIGRQISQQTGAQFSDHPSQLSQAINLVILTVSDQAIGQVCSQLPEGFYSLVHTSGSTPMQALSQRGGSHGVFYPLYTFSREVIPMWPKIPFFIEADQAALNEQLFHLAEKTGGVAFGADSLMRLQLHLAAVFASNFTNHLIDLSQYLVERSGLDESLIHPLVEETCRKALAMGGVHAQTGPAKRGDVDTIKKHLELLSYNHNFQELYDLLSQSIARRMHGEFE